MWTDGATNAMLRLYMCCAVAAAALAAARASLQASQVAADDLGALPPPLRFSAAAHVASDPAAAAAFVAAYVGGEAVAEAPSAIEEGVVEGDVVHAVRFAAGPAGADDEPPFAIRFAAPADGARNASEALAFSASLESIHAVDMDQQESWCFWDDDHVTMGYLGDDLAPVLGRLRRDGVPFRTRGAGAQVFVPGSGMVLQVLGVTNESEITSNKEHFDFCSVTTDEGAASGAHAGASAVHPGGVEEWVDGALDRAATRPLPAYRPSHAAVATARPEEVEEALLKLLPHAQTRRPFFESYHEHGDGKCALLRWLSLAAGPESGGSGFEMHLVNQFNKREGGMPVAETKAAIEAAHRAAFSASTPGAFALNRLVMSGAPGAAAAYAARARALGLPALARGASAVLVALPGGVVLEIADAEAGASEASAA